MSPAMEAISISNLRKNYGSVVAVEDLTLRVRAGTLFGFLGPNGSGKSTTIGCLTGLLDPTSGDMRLFGEPMTPSSAALKRRIGVMPENLALFEPLYAHEFLSFHARIFGLEEDTARRRTAELLEALELTDTRKQLSEFSAGMRKRIAFAAAVIHSPELLFLDEPFESIDPAGVALMKTWLRRFVDQGKTVFLTTHVLDTVERLCEEAAIITKPGKLVWQGDITALSRDGSIKADGCEFDALEPLFLHLTGEKYTQLEWL